MILRLDWVQFFGACGSAAAAVATRNWSVDWLGVPLPVLLAAFAGAGLILSFLPPRTDGRGRMLCTVVLCTLLGAYGAHPATLTMLSLAGADLLCAFTLAGLGQVIIPLVIEHRVSIVKWIAARFPFGKGGAP